MGVWRVSADLLAGSRFTLSPLAETTAALTVLGHPVGPWQQAFHASHATAYGAMLDEHPVRRELGARAWRPRRGDRPGWMADFLSPAPSAPGMSVDDELEVLAREWDDERIRAALYAVRPGRLPDVLLRDGLREELLGLYRWLWTATLESDWPRRSRVLQADVVSRTALLATKGWAAVVESLGHRKAWLGDGRLRINGYDLPDRDLGAATQLWFVPVHSNGSWVAWEEPHRYAIVYPVTGALAAPGPAVASSGALERLLGAGRASVLLRLDDPRTTTQLVALTGLPLGSVGGHLKVLLDSGLVLRRRAGREVLYWRTAIGDGLAATRGRG
ncbi:ArsR/SmtB family transcription factor [Lapillicoccus jejuensis]|uniref:ArsR family transcriptional regulator n=1 Tax=Lapillicoccus jejuensis TaxID=402171 RepID=A0A542DZX1_9MICO|nr:helix-turn-helix domain-containing protein [Lapillicoccus jejuensis]TQJ08661.1 hypothetical protein FB458_1752 [Lapillicoccus jejuensis]